MIAAPDLTTDEMRERVERAAQEVHALCATSRRWTMTVPAEPDRDSDLVIGEALRIARLLLDERDGK